MRDNWVLEREDGFGVFLGLDRDDGEEDVWVKLEYGIFLEWTFCKIQFLDCKLGAGCLTDQHPPAKGAGVTHQPLLFCLGSDLFSCLCLVNMIFSLF